MIYFLNCIIPYIGIAACILVLILRRFKTVKFDTVSVYYVLIIIFGSIAFRDFQTEQEHLHLHATTLIRLASLFNVLLITTIIRRYTISHRKVIELRNKLNAKNKR